MLTAEEGYQDPGWHGNCYSYDVMEYFVVSEWVTMFFSWLREVRQNICILGNQYESFVVSQSVRVERFCVLLKDYFQTTESRRFYGYGYHAFVHFLDRDN